MPKDKKAIKRKQKVVSGLRKKIRKYEERLKKYESSKYINTNASYVLEMDPYQIHIINQE